MKKIIFVFAMCFFVAAPAFARGGYYETRVSACDEESMRRALDNATANGRAVITTVKCDAAPVRPIRTVRYEDLCCDCF